MKNRQATSGFGAAATSRGFGGFASSSSINLSYITPPPDLASISDSNAVVIFKTILKRDSTTKARGLDDLVTYVDAHPFEQDGGVEDAVLEAWVQVYPRLAIDNSRRVRELSHIVQTALTKSGRKRMEKRLPRVTASWLAGTLDKDRAVSRAAIDGIASVFNNEAKVLHLWVKCQIQILEYAEEAVRETPSTLSDERSTQKDDADDMYFRVMAGSLGLVTGLLRRLSAEDVEKHRPDYDQFFEIPIVFALTSAADTEARKAAFRLTLVCMEKYPDLLGGHVARLGKALIPAALDAPQPGSLVELLQVLLRLTDTNPEVWSSKKTPLSRLRKLAEKGSQLGGATVWNDLNKLLQAVPLGTVALEDASKYLQALASGINGRQERRGEADVKAAVRCYLDACTYLMEQLPSGQARADLASKYLLSLLEAYISAEDRTDVWSQNPSRSIYADAFNTCLQQQAPEVRSAAAVVWQKLSDGLVALMRNSLPAVSKDFERSQRKVAEVGERWFDVRDAVATEQVTQPKSEQAANDELLFLTTSAHKIVTGACDLLQRRNYKPFGLASIILRASQAQPNIFDGEVLATFFAAFPGDAQEAEALLASSSAKQLLTCLTQLGPRDEPRFRAVWQRLIDNLRQTSTAMQTNGTTAGPQSAASAITGLLAAECTQSWAREDEQLQTWLRDTCTNDSHVDTSCVILRSILQKPVISSETRTSIVERILSRVTHSAKPSTEDLDRLEVVLTEKPALILDNKEWETALLTMLLGAMELDDGEIASKAHRLRTLVEQGANGESSTTTIIQQHLDTANSRSLDIATVAQQAGQALNAGASLESVLPSTNVWMEQLSLFLQDAPNASLSITSALSGSYLLVQPLHARAAVALRDRRGDSAPIRMAKYLTLIFDQDSIQEANWKSISLEVRTELLYLLAMTAEIASDQLMLMSRHGLWQSLTSDQDARNASDLVSALQKLLNNLLKTDPTRNNDLEQSYLSSLLRQSSGFTPQSLYSARALEEYCRIRTDETLSPDLGNRLILEHKLLQSNTGQIFAAVACLKGCGEALGSGKAATTFLNRLIGDVGAASPKDSKTLTFLVLLNACTSLYEQGDLPVVNHRQVLAVKQILSWTKDGQGDLEAAMATEICKALAHLLPCIKEVYGSYWDDTLDFCLALWARSDKNSAEQRLPYVHASVKLVQILQKIDTDNDDLQDALKSHAKAVSNGLVGLLKSAEHDISQPTQIVNALICRQCQKLPIDDLQDLSDIYGLVASDSREIQTAAYSILHRAIPSAQEKLSVDVLLEKRDAHLPDELLSLLLDAPALESYPEDVLIQFPTSVRAYLLSWVLVFDAFSGASEKVRKDYTHDLKAHNSIDALLRFTFDFLGHTNGNALNLNKKGFTDDNVLRYDLNTADAEPPEHNMDWLLIHLFHCILKYTPGLFRAWFLDARDKQTKLAVQTWMTKYFSPLIIASALDEVQQWADSQEAPQDDQDRQLEIKIHRPAREVIASYEVDESQGSIKLVVPEGFPLDNVVVTGVNRVAVAENKWRSWLMNTQGVIMFSNGNIVDGLSAFRRNVVGALKGQSECAICYSIISADKKLPDKKCGTCKNLFHRHCLYKWFVSSNQNSCPLCRTPIDYIGSDRTQKRGGRGGTRGGRGNDSDDD